MVNALLDAVAARKTPWIRVETGWLSGEDLTHALKDSDEQYEIVLVLDRDGAAAVLADALALSSAGQLPLLWPSRVAIPTWLRTLLAEPATACRALWSIIGDRYPQSTLIGVCSSGTSGTGKVVILDVARCLNCAREVAARHGANPSSSPRIVVSLRSIAYSAGFVADALGSLFSGSWFWHPSHAAPELFTRSAGRMDLTDASLRCTGAVAERLLRTSMPAPQQLVLSGDLISSGFVRALRSRWPTTDVWIAYGLAEAGPRVAVDKVAEDYRTGELPTLLSGVSVSIIAGELIVSSPYAALAVLDGSGPRAVASGRISTGDRAVVDSRGRFLLQGRRDATFAVAGTGVQTDLVEAQLRDHGILASVTPLRQGWRVTVTGALESATMDGDRNARAAIRGLVRKRFPFLPAPDVTFAPAPALTVAGKRIPSSPATRS
ncbi:MAG: AMP-binding protein [Pseudonocardiales bacterium]|nr:AMP-binding protein [Pseudonocardiales bacterium]